MKHLPKTVSKAIAATQDGGTLAKADRFSSFINDCIDYNTEGYTADNSRHVLVEDLIDDFNYMIDQLKKAIPALKNLND